jgi:triosephosphate isomerase
MNPFRRPLIAGNWKMNAGGRDACELAEGVAQRTDGFDLVDVVVAPPFTALAAVAHEIEEARGSVDVEEGRGIGIAAQNMHASASGAFTGEVSATMLLDAGATWVILGHSERRQLFGETDELVADKTRAAMASRLRPIVCVGETLSEREAGRTLEVVEAQVRAIMHAFVEAPGFAAIAYEPVWAIGTGKVAKPEDAQLVHARIRELLAEVNEEVAELTRILYGGSVKADNAAGLLAQDDVDGALVGGAALDADGFGRIVEAAHARMVVLREEDDGAGLTEPSPPVAPRQASLFDAASSDPGDEPPIA